MKVKIYNQQGESRGETEVDSRFTFKGVSPQVVHDAVVAYRANQRMGTACTKTIAEVTGSGKKPYKQKGTGRARAGLVRSPLWRKGGVVFGPKPRDYSKRMPREIKRLAFDQALAGRIKSDDVIVVESFDVQTSKTKDFTGILKKLPVKGFTLLVHESPSANLRLASRNVATVQMVSAASVNAYQLLDCDKIVITQAALRLLGARGVQQAEAA
ncbi:MAG: 50S ribosomal protein L4 [Verrucomicrobiae bacterium]|nr:50S ribosomal protein L4 [Verrucomicrobiae bacterium]